MRTIDDFKQFRIVNADQVKGGAVVYVPDGNQTHVYDCHIHPGSGDVCCVYISTIGGQVC